MQDEETVSGAHREYVSELKSRAKRVALLLKSADDVVVRQDELMKRHSSNRWSPEKVARAVRRFTQAVDDVNVLEQRLDELVHELEKAGVKTDAFSRSDVIVTKRS